MTTFGDYLQAARLGFHWSKTLQAYLRIGTFEHDWRIWQIELSPPGCLPYQGATREYVRWWEDADPERVVQMSPVLSEMGRQDNPDSYLSFPLGMDGTHVNT